MKKKYGIAALFAAVSLCTTQLSSQFLPASVTLTAAAESQQYEGSESGYYMGDVNSDGLVGTSDLVLLNKWLLAVPDTHLENWQAADFCRDEILDVYDLCMLRRQIVSGDAPEWISTGENMQSQLIPATVSKFGKLTPSVGNARMLSIFVEFSDTKFSRPLPAETVRQQLFGSGNKGYPYDSITDWYERSSYGNLHFSGDVYYCSLPGTMADYMNDDRFFEDFAMAVLTSLDSQIDYSDYDGNQDGVIDCLSIGVPLDYADEAQKEYWWSCTATWWKNWNFSLDGKTLNKYIILDTPPYEDKLRSLKSVLTHEMGHSLGLPDYYLYEAGDDWEAYYGDAGFERMDDSIGDFSSFSKLMYGWLRDDEVQWYSGGTQSFKLRDSLKQGSCLIVPVGSEVGDVASEYFLVEYVTHNGNNADLYPWTLDSGIRIFHIQADLKPVDWWGYTNFMYEGFSDYYLGNDFFRVTRLVNDGFGFYHSGDVCSYGTKNFAAYDSNGLQTIDTGITIEIGELVNGEYTVTVRK